MRLSIADVAGRALFSGEAPVTHVHQLPALLAQHYPSDGVHFYHFVFAHGEQRLETFSELPQTVPEPLELVALVAPVPLGGTHYIPAAYIHARKINCIRVQSYSVSTLFLNFNSISKFGGEMFLCHSNGSAGLQHTTCDKLFFTSKSPWRVLRFVLGDNYKGVMPCDMVRIQPKEEEDE
jgi:hypothetical protein